MKKTLSQMDSTLNCTSDLGTKILKNISKENQRKLSWEITKLKDLDRALVIQGLVQAQERTKVIFLNLIKSALK